MRVLYFDTFQPYMLSHSLILDEIANCADEIIIGILGVHESHTITEPFRAGGKMLMISNDLQNFSIPVYIVPIGNIGRNLPAVSHIISLVPVFSAVYTQNKILHRLFIEAGITAFHPPETDVSISAKDWILSVLNGGKWGQYVPESTKSVICDISGDARIQKMSETD